MHRRLAYFVLSAALLAACGGGGGGGGSSPVPTGGGGGGGTVPTSNSNLPLQETAGGSMAWVEPSSHKTLYFLDVETTTAQSCTQAAGGCLGVWPIFAPSATSANTANMTIFTRADGAGKQWAYQGHPLYTYTGDTGADQANGEGVPDFGGHWHVARPDAAAAPSPAPGATEPPGCNIYC